MTGFDETVPPDPDDDPSADATAADDADTSDTAYADDNVVKPEGGPEAVDADDERAPAPMAGDDDIASGHLSG